MPLSELLKKRAQENGTGNFRATIERVVYGELAKYKEEIMREMRATLEATLSEEGVRTLKGDRGYTPQRGIDFLTVREMSEIKKELKGKDADEDSIARKVLSQIAIPEQDEDVVVRKVLSKIVFPKQKEFPVPSTKEMASELARAFELLPEKEKLDFYKGLKNRPSSTESGVRTIHRGGQGLAVFAIDLSAQCDGSRKTFTVPVHTRFLSLSSSQFPGEYRPTVDYTTSGTTLTLTDEVAPPESGQTLTGLYAR